MSTLDQKVPGLNLTVVLGQAFGVNVKVCLGAAK